LQQLNIIEGIICHLLLRSKPQNDAVSQILPLFNQHCKLMDSLKALGDASKKAHKQLKQSAKNNSTSACNLTLNGVPVKTMCTQPENIWDLAILDKLLHLLLE